MFYEDADLKKTILITGSTNGIGEATALKLAQVGFENVLILGRNDLKIKNTIDKIEKQTGTVYKGYKCDVSDLSSINQFIDSLTETIDILVNNAGIARFNYTKCTLHGKEIDSMLMTNHLGPFYLTLQLLKLQKINKKGRIVNISSMAHEMGYPTAKFETVFNPNNNYKYISNFAYGTTKLYNGLFCHSLRYIYLDKYYPQLQLSCCWVHPGFIPETGAVGEGYYGWIVNNIFKYVPIAKSVGESADFLMKAMFAKEADGKYLHEMEFKTPVKSSFDRNLQIELWNNSCLLLKIPEFELN